jgi:hypothetical protein
MWPLSIASALQEGAFQEDKPKNANAYHLVLQMKITVERKSVLICTLQKPRLRLEA